jgi:hypothetical protein
LLVDQDPVCDHRVLPLEILIPEKPAKKQQRESTNCDSHAHLQRNLVLKVDSASVRLGGTKGQEQATKVAKNYASAGLLGQEGIWLYVGCLH